MQFVRVPSRGSSMWPTVRDGDVLLVTRGGAVRLGDLILLDTGQSLLAHRLLAVDRRLIRCGNARGQVDPWISVDAVFGRVVGIERKGRLLPVGRDGRGVGVLWALRSGYGLARRVLRLSRKAA